MMSDHLLPSSGFTKHKWEVFSGMVLNISLTASLTPWEFSQCQPVLWRQASVGPDNQLRFLLEQGHSFLPSPLPRKPPGGGLASLLGIFTLGLPANPEEATANDFIHSFSFIHQLPFERTVMTLTVESRHSAQHTKVMERKVLTWNQLEGESKMPNTHVFMTVQSLNKVRSKFKFQALLL